MTHHRLDDGAGVPDPRRRRGRQHPLPFLLGAASGLNAYLAHYPAFAYNGQVAWIRRAILGLIGSL